MKERRAQFCPLSSVWFGGAAGAWGADATSSFGTEINTPGAHEVFSVLPKRASDFRLRPGPPPSKRTRNVCGVGHDIQIVLRRSFLIHKNKTTTVIFCYLEFLNN